MAYVVTIDGPAASGKTSVSREIANRMGWSWVSTGAFYRGIAFVAQETGVPLDDEEKLVQLCQSGVWKVQMEHERTQVFLQGKDVTPSIYLENVGNAASKISQFPRLREALLDAQRKCADQVDGLVAEGRDCGTVVFPTAEMKFYLTARSEDRAKRRALEEGGDLKKTQEDQLKRDEQDSKRKAAPMQVPENAHVVDTSNMNLEQVVNEVERLIREKQ